MFKLITKSSKSSARLGELTTNHGVIETPFFMPIATKASIKGLTVEELDMLGVQILLSNTYHLWLRPGEDIVKNAGGLHEFMKWDKLILTDSGGYQVFSLAKMRKISRDGVKFQSHINGEKKFLTPEKAIEIQQALGSDIMMVLDECAPYPCGRDDAKLAVERTSRWAEISSKIEHSNQLMFGIVQGSTYKDLRLQSAKDLVALDFDGYAVGGLAVGEPVEKMYETLDYTVPELPKDKPRYLMGVGYPEQIVESVKRGIDMFDCVIPTRNARHGTIFVNLREIDKENFYNVIHIKNEKYKDDFSVLDESCDCPTCKAGYTKSYLRHLLVCEEPLYIRLATLHNLRFYIKLMEKIRNSIKQDVF
ncbi:MAG: hypothetical protein ACD_63C00249G0005 [uncultured bacterium]|nr:MAG: hypothetical protein ACD_63C00249G0005 [uncultured bacterium]